MVNKKKNHIIVIGGGYGGLSFAAIMAKFGHRVTVLEAHTYLGGCASFFKRHQYKFDCGATTLSGLNQSRPLRILTDLTEVDFKTQHLEEPMRIILPSGKVINRFRDHEKFMEELERVFPLYNHREYWDSLKEKEQRLWKILGASQYFPPKNFNDIKALLKPDILKNADLGVHAFTPLSKLTPREFLEDPDYRAFLDEQLIISTQSKIEEVPSLIGAMGLVYPEDMHYSKGGISTLAYKLKEVIEENGGQILLRHKVEEVIPQKEGIIVKAMAPAGKNWEEEAEIVVSNLTIWDTPKLFQPSYKRKLLKQFKIEESDNTRGAWGAVTGSWGVKCKKPITTLYHQVHLQKDEGDHGSFFFSLSHPDDRERAPEGYQTVSVSTHTLISQWEKYKDQADYLKEKAKWEVNFLRAFHRVFEENGIEEIERIDIGTPKTFQKFTRRHRGLVGGLPHNIKNNILTFPSQETPITNFFQIGDTTFPGQGIVGVTTGALILAGKLLGRNFLKD